MPRMTSRFNWGSEAANNNPELVRQLSEVQSDTTLVVNTKISKRIIDGTDAPATSTDNKNYEIGDIWVRTDTNTAWIMTSRTNDTTVNWQQIT